MCVHERGKRGGGGERLIKSRDEKKKNEARGT